MSDLEVVRRIVREVGKEANTYRLTPQEKKSLLSVIYDCRQQDIRTNENEIARIAINFLVHDFRRNGTASILSRVLHLLKD